MDESDSDHGSLNASSIMRWPANVTIELNENDLSSLRNYSENSNKQESYNLTYNHVNYGDNNYWALLALILVVSNSKEKLFNYKLIEIMQQLMNNNNDN